jgi:hypothetical protein
VSSNASNVAAMVAAVSGENTMGMPISNRRNTMSKNASARSAAVGSLPSPPASLPGHRIRLTTTGKLDMSESAIDDENSDEETAFKQSRMRRASEGQHLTTEGKKINGDLKCDKCVRAHLPPSTANFVNNCEKGKNYKHSSCLSKHLWEHTVGYS